MKSLKDFSGRKFVVAALAVAALTFLPARSAFADQFQYVFTGVADGTVNGTLYTNAQFTLTFIEDTSTIDNRGVGYYSYDNVNATLSAGQVFTLTGVTLEVNGSAGFQNVDFYDSTFTNGLGLSGVTPLNYDLTTNMNAPITSSGLTPTLPPVFTGTFTDTAADTIQFTNSGCLGFTATDLTPAPEPSSLLLLTSGLPGLALLRRRFLKA